VVSEVHANFIVNRDGASAADILGLVEEVKNAVAQATGIVLEEEVALWEPSGENA
jgi:UDP-N-acetylmuramate dehydrogenase